MSTITTEIFVNRAKEVHGDLYDYSKSIYVKGHDKLIIICKIHGEFLKSPANHLKGQGCPICGDNRTWDLKRMSVEEFIKRSKEKFGDVFTYDRVNYKNNSTSIIITCKKHGDFSITPSVHLQKNPNKGGCKLCYKEKPNKRIPLSNEFYISKLKEIYGDKYDYSKMNYVKQSEPITIICKIHGEFKKYMSNHLSGSGCSKCYYETKKSNTDEFIKKSKEAHGDKYEYSKVNYILCSDKVVIICKKHGEFTQIPSAHIKGVGCPKCLNSTGERTISNYLKSLNIEFEEQKKFSSCKYRHLLRFDFWLPKYNLLIEFDGRQHYPEESPKKYRFRHDFDKIKIRDEIKTKWCEEYQVNLLRIKYNDDIEKVINDYLEFIK